MNASTPASTSTSTSASTTPSTAQFQVPQTIAIGAGARHQTGAHLQTLGIKRVLLICDPGVISLGFHNDVRASLENHDFEIAIFDGVQPDPSDTNIADGHAAVLAHKAEAIVAVGGGSVMDAAKIIAVAPYMV